MDSEDIPNLQAVVDRGAMGPEPSEDYLQRLELLDNVVRECIFVSKSYSGIESSSLKHFYASVLFTVLLTRGLSLLMLAPHSPWSDKRVEHWDYASMTGIVRTMIEVRAAFYYLCVEECSSEEWEFRWNLFNLHDCVSRIRMFEARGEHETVQEFAGQADELRESLRASSFFQQIDPKKRKKILHGQTAYLSPLEEIMEKAGVETDTFRWLYIFFSSHVHALPMSFYRMGSDGDERGRGLPSPVEESYSTLCLALAANLIVSSRDELHILFEGLRSKSAEAGVDQPSIDDAINEVAVGDSGSIDVTDDVRLVFTRTSEDEYTTTYISRSDGSEVLKRRHSDVDGGSIEWFDPFFWSFRVNSGPATEQMISDALGMPHIFRVDHTTREIVIKTE